MQDALCVSMIEGARDWPEDPDDLLEVHRAAETLRESSTFHQFEHQIGNAALLPEIEDVENVRVLEPRNRPRLLLEAFAVTLVFGKEIGKDLDRDVGMEGGLVGPIDARHPAATDAGDDPVLAQRESVGQRHESSFARATIAVRPRVRTIRALLRW